MKGRIRWALFTAFLSVVLAVVLGIAALTYSDEPANATPAGPIEGNYAFVATTIATSVPGPNGQPAALSLTGGRLSIGGDAHAFWSLQMVSAGSTSRTGRLSCEGTFNRTNSTIALEPRFGFSGFPPEADRREVQDQIYVLFCAIAGGQNNAAPVSVQQNGGLLQLSGAGGSISWRRE